MKNFSFTNYDLFYLSTSGTDQVADLAGELLEMRQAVEHDGRTCNCDPEFRSRTSPGVCVIEPCLYEAFHLKGETHKEYHDQSCCRQYHEKPLTSVKYD